MTDFIVMGAVKAGTTSLYHYLGQHPDIQMSRMNWPRFFHVDGAEPDFERLRSAHGDALLAESQWRYRQMCHREVPRTIDAYKKLWPGDGRARLCGEVSPTYLHDPDTLDRIRLRFPDVRLMVVLRQPADRAGSHFVMDATRGWVRERSFVDALKREPIDIDEFWWGARHYYRHGLYASRVEQLLDVFDEERIKVCLYDDYSDEPEQFMHNLFDFIGVDPNFAVDMSRRHNQGRVPADTDAINGKAPGRPEWVKSPSLSRSLRGNLTGHYRPDILRLQELIGRDLSVWLAERND